MRRARLLPALTCLAFLQISAVPAAAAPDSAGPEIVLSTMSYVGSEAGAVAMRLAAARARLLPGMNRVLLEDVQASVPSDAKLGGFELRCDTAELDVEAGDVVATGHVRGRTGDGRRIETDRLQYRHETGLVFTDSTVTLRDETGTYRGGGLRYLVRDGSLKLLRGATVGQE